MASTALRFAAETGLAKLRLCGPNLKGPVMNAAADMPTPPPEDAGAEVDIWWGGYAGRAMIPSFLVCIAATLTLIVSAIYLANAFNMHGDLVRYLVYATAGALWTIQLLRWGLRIIGVNYRVTTRRIYCWKSLRAAPGKPIELAAVDRVQVEETWLERLLGVGRVRIVSRDGELTLSGLAQPRQVAAIVEHRVKQSRPRNGA